MRISILLLSLCFCFSCSTFFDAEEVERTGLQNKLDTQLNASLKEHYEAPFFLDSVYIEGTELWIEVSFSGGCEKHDFMVVWPEMITQVYPPDFGISLHHNHNGDHCEALIGDVLKIDLSDTPIGDFDPETIQEMRITVINGSRSEESKSSR